MASVQAAGAPTSNAISPTHVTFFAVAVVLIVVSTVFVALRFWSRTLGKSTGSDDWTSLGALILAWAFVICDPILLTTIGHSGYNVAAFTQQQLQVYMELNFVSCLFYIWTTTLAKTSVLLFYRRVFSVKSFKPWIWAVVAIVGAYFLSLTLAIILSNNPVEAFWKPWIPHSAININAVYLAACVGSASIDAIILALPQPLVWNLQISLKQKVLLSLLLMLGLFTIIAVILRTIYLERGDIKNFGMWSVVEVNISIICGCGPMLPRLWRHYSGRTPSSSLFKFRSNSNSSWLRKLRKSHDTKSDQSSDIATPVSLEKGTLYPEDSSTNAVRVQREVSIHHVDRSVDVDREKTSGW